MEWKEVIHLMAFDKKSANQALSEAGELTLIRGKEAPQCIEVLDGNGLDLDICVLLHWSRKTHHMAKSIIGTTIANALTRFGWVSHSVWRSKSYAQSSGV